jgi:hypothetical protein
MSALFKFPERTAGFLLDFTISRFRLPPSQARIRMCFVLYIGTDEPLPTIPWDEKSRHLNTKDLGDHDKTVPKHFTKPWTKYLGSDQGCGCGFRHVTFHNGEWAEEWNTGNDAGYDGSDEDQIHRELFEFVASLISTNGTVELYGCWDGDFEDPIEHREVISVDRLIDRSFFFRERGFYTVTNSEQAGAPG